MMTEQVIDYTGDGGAEDVLRWAIDKFTPRIALACSFQMNALVHMVMEISRDVTLFAIDTGRLNEETYECARDIERRYGIQIRWYFPRHDAVEGLVRNKGLFSFRESVDNRKECCHIRKVEPLNRALSEFDVRFAIPWVQLVILTIVAIVIGILAAIMPARRAAKLNPLEAIAYE